MQCGGEMGMREAWRKQFEPLFTQGCIFLSKKLYLGIRGACGGGRLAGIYLYFIFYIFQAFSIFYYLKIDS